MEKNWFFEGDICEEEDSGYKAIFRFYYEHGAFYIEYEDADAYPLDEILNGNGEWDYPVKVPVKVIGNIHEEEV
ncbi:MAG: hypothetical protein ABFC94_15710 [Syntrophomonas sp.]